ncbi:MAG: pirin family protein [Pseudomonadota bacterium]
MISIRKNADRGHGNHGWLDARHTFSFAHYHHPEQMGFRSLRVINEDRINPGAGFAPHGHKDMEIITYVLEGAVRHQDSTGGGGVIRPGMVQYMSAGRGVTHSEMNASEKDLLHLYQIWILPDANGLAPRYEERKLNGANDGAFELVASKTGRDKSIQINQDADLLVGKAAAGEKFHHAFEAGRFGWLQVAKGGIELPGGSILHAGDGARIIDEPSLAAKALADSEILLFDLA